MKTKLTITIDREVLPRAKRYARKRGVSLSSLIEASLRTLADPPERPFSVQWQGRFKAARRRDPRYRALAAKYL